ncbi:MAG: DNA-processing protein DprA [Parcubacteria group bacterium]|jgi:DNA processing protein
MQNNEKIFWHAFNSIGGFGPQKFRKLLAFFSTLAEAWQASHADMLRSGIGEKLTELFLSKRSQFDLEKMQAGLLKEKIEILTIRCDAYPSMLKEIASAPPVIYIRGNPSALSNKSLAIVGSRKYTPYGERVAENICKDLVRSGLSITSGLALGIDAISHRAALDAGGETIAILGSGLDDVSIFPRENFNLARRILENDGALVSEYPPGTPSYKQNFPARNRIMAGLTLGTLVVEAALESGSLITARLALEFNREVFSVPGSIFSPQSTGTNYLIKSGAKLVESAKDILEELNISSSAESANGAAKKIFKPETKEEETLWKILGNEPLHIDRLQKLAKLNPATLNSTLATLEIQGAIKNIGGQNYIRL